jgi:hypothetical protein
MSNVRWLQRAALALILTLSTGSPAPALAASGRPAALQTAVGKVNATDSSYFELKRIDLLPDQNGKLAAFTITFHNQGSSELQFIDYWVSLKSKSGNKFSARLLPADKDKNKVAPGSSTDISFYAKVNATTNLQDLIVQFIRWDFNQPDFESIIGEVAIPSTYTNVTPVDAAAIIPIAGTDVQASVKKLVSNKNEKYHVPTVYLTLENVGTHSLTMPAYLFSIRTSEGLMYPLEAKGVKDLTVNPKESKEIQLSGTIPVSVSADNWQLAITENVADLKMNFPIASFELPKVSQQEGGSIGQSYTFISESGVYTAQLNALYRLPWEDDDILTADLTLSNKGESSLPIPELTGYFMLDGGVKVQAKLVTTSKIIALGAGDGVSFQFAGKIPYTYEFSQVKLVLQEKESDTVTTDVLDFSSQAELQAIPFHNRDEPYTLTDIGRKSTFKVRSVSSYNGKTGTIFTAQVEVENLEKRFASVSKLAAHFRTPDGTIFPAAVAEVKNKISPSGKALFNVWASLPKGYPTANMHLVLGEAVTEGKLTEGDAKPDSYVKPVAFWLPDQNNEVKSVLKDVQLFPYTISMDHIGTQINYNKLELKFNYELTKDLSAETNTEGHKLILGFEDSKGNKSFEKSYDLKDFSPAEGQAPLEDADKLKLGKYEGFKITVEDPDLIFKQEFLKQYTLSLYDEFQGQRKQLAAQQISWFTVTD